MKDRWRERVRVLFGITTPADAERIALRRAHHNKCGCWMCQHGGRGRPTPTWRAEDEK